MARGWYCATMDGNREVHAMMTVVSRFIRGLALALLALSGPAAAEESESPFDILGFRLGMTPEQVASVFRQLNPDMDLKTDHRHFRYSDGLADHQTESFVGRLSGNIRLDGKTKSTLYVAVEFSPPPEGGRAVQIVRSDSNIVNPVTLAEYRDALIAKYGPPSAERYGLQWHFPADRTLCSNSANGPVAGQLGTLAQGRDRAQKLADPSQCASYLSFRMTGDPVTDVYARLIDVEHAIRSQLAANAWVARQQAEAVEARKAKGKGPEL
jgi:hypothetical protein